MGRPAGKLTFELTESALIDDFGTGCSSLVYLQRLPVLEVKADRSFVMTMATVESDAVIVRAIVDLAHNLSVNVVAEGVEDAAKMASPWSHPPAMRRRSLRRCAPTRSYSRRPSASRAPSSAPHAPGRCRATSRSPGPNRGSGPG